MTVDELHEILTVYEMRIDEYEQPTRREASFKASRKTKDRGNKE